MSTTLPKPHHVIDDAEVPPKGDCGNDPPAIRARSFQFATGEKALNLTATLAEKIGCLLTRENFVGCCEVHAGTPVCVFHNKMRAVHENRKDAGSENCG